MGTEKPEEPRDAVAQIMASTGLDEGFVRSLAAVGRVAERVGAWSRMRAVNLGAAANEERRVEAPKDLVAEISERSGVETELVRQYLVVRHAAEVIGMRAWTAPESDAWRRLHGLRTLFALTLPLPAWVDDVIGELGVEEGERWRARDLLVAVMALARPDERAARAWLEAGPEDGGKSPAEATREGGLDALEQRLVTAYPATDADVGSEGR